MSGLRMVFGLFSSIPMGNFPFDEETYQRSVWALVLVGAVMALALNGVLLLPIKQPMMALLLSLIYLILSGAIHLDGFGDTLDGMLSRRDGPRALEIMRDPHLGTFGMLGIIVYIASLIICLMLVASPWSLVFPVIGRLMAFVVCYRRQSARPGGLGDCFITGVHPLLGFIGLGLMIAVALWLKEWIVGVAIAISLVMSLMSERWIHLRLGGMTGDTIGFSIEFSQLVYLLVLALGASWH